MSVPTTASSPASYAVSSPVLKWLVHGHLLQRMLSLSLRAHQSLRGIVFGQRDTLHLRSLIAEQDKGKRKVVPVLN
jgi:hypothetical protein